MELERGAIDEDEEASTAATIAAVRAALSGDALGGVVGEQARRELCERVSVLEAAWAALRALAALDAAYAADARHALRAPLTAIALYSGMRASADEGRRARHGAAMARETRRLCALVDDLTALAELDLDAVRGAPRPADRVDLGDVVASVVARLDGARERVDVVAPDAAAAGRCAVPGERVLLERAVAHLARNALVYSRDPAPVSVNVRREGAMVRLVVADAGVGIRAGETARLCERFFRGEAALELDVPGNGLGLAIVRATARRHGGGVRFEPGRATGTRIELDLPAWEGSS